MPKSKPKKSAPKSTAVKPKNKRQIIRKLTPAKRSKQSKHDLSGLPSAFVLLKDSVKVVWPHRKILGGVLLVYGLLQAVLVQGLFGNEFVTFNDTLKLLTQEQWGSVASGLTSFSYLIGTIGQTSSPVSGLYQSILLVLGSLAFIWAMRQVLAGKTIRIRDAYYRGMYPLVPFLLVLMVVGLQLIPLLIGSWIYAVVSGNAIAVTLAEQIAWLVVFAVFAALTLYMICASVFAVYIVTLPEMTPVHALRSAHDLVRFRRWSVLRKLLFIGFVVFIGISLIVVPVIILAPAAAPFVLYVCSVLALGLVHVYLYHIYRELLANG